MYTPSILRDSDPANGALSEHSATESPSPLDVEGARSLEGVEQHLVSLLSPHSFEADQYRNLRHFLQQATAGSGLKVLAVTSPAAGDGKTTTAINLAVTLAQSPGARVVLIDTDLRRPCVATSLGLDDTRGGGLSTTVRDPQMALQDVVERTPFNFHVLPAGPPPPNAYQVLDSPRLGELLEQARRSYDYVVLDAPPVLVVPDCSLMSQCVDGFLMVVAAHRTPRKLLAEALGALNESKVLGIIFNADDRPLSGYYKQYSGYYGYHRKQSGGEGRRWWPFSWRGRKRGRSPWWR
jgi:capsular exopolysaccharide synthesis family protein